MAGVGNDPRGEARVFNPVKQAHDYDPRGEYCMAWVEELRGLDNQGEGVLEVYQPHLVSQERRIALGLAGREGVEKPLKKIDFRLGKHGKGSGGGGGGGGGGRYGGSSRGWAKNGDGWKGGRGGGRARGGGGQRYGGRGERGEKRGEMAVVNGDGGVNLNGRY